jgi:uncharacterized membrane protein YcaP (DUF421 family)
MEINLWSGPSTFWGAAVSAALVYVVVITLVRVAGRRTLARMSGYDIVVTVAIGTLAASTALPADASLADGAAVLVTFLLLQVLIGALRQRWAWFRQLVDFHPHVVVRDGRPELPRAPWTAQLTLAELESALRRNGASSMEEVRLALLEPTGKVTLVRAEEVPSLFRGVERPGSATP